MFTGLESPSHLIIVLVIILLLFGAKRIPELAKGLGTGMREFKRGISEENEAQDQKGKSGIGEGPGNRDQDGAS